MSIVSTIGNIYFVYQFLKKLVTPFEKTKAFELGIIDEKGKILKRRRDLKTKDEKEAYTLSDTLIWNIKKLLGKVPGGQSRIASYAAALFLIKEQHGDYKITDEELELQFFDKFEQMYNNDNLLFDEKTLLKVETALNEDEIIMRKGKKIILKPLTFIHQRPKHSVKTLSVFLNTCSKYLATQDWFGQPVEAKKIIG